MLNIIYFLLKTPLRSWAVTLCKVGDANKSEVVVFHVMPEIIDYSRIATATDGIVIRSQI